MALIDFIGNGSSGSFASPDIDSQNSVANAASRLSVNETAGITLKVHKYPLFIDRGKQNSKIEETVRECIRFTVVKQGGVTFKQGDLEKARKAGIKKTRLGLTGIIDSASSKLQQITQGVIAGKITQREQRERFESIANQFNTANEDRDALDANVDNVPVLAVGLAFGKDKLAEARQPFQNLEHCFLYMPASVVYSEGATWGAESLGAGGNAIKEMIKGQSDIGKILGDFGAGMAPIIAKAAAVAAGAAVAGVFGALSTAVLGGGIVAGASVAARIVQNPYEEQLFSGIPFRVFNFSFEFIATSKTEFKEVSKIINMFREHSRPTFSIDKDLSNNSQNEALYSYPNEFAIEFMHLNDSDVFERNEFLPKIHNCVLTNITTNFAPDGWIAHEEGEPVSIITQLAFTETKKNTRNDIVKGGY